MLGSCFNCRIVSITGDYSSSGGLYSSQYHGSSLPFSDQHLTTAQALLASSASTVTSSDYISEAAGIHAAGPGLGEAIVKTENDNLNNLDEEEDTTEDDDDKDDQMMNEDSKEANSKPPYSYVAMIGEKNQYDKTNGDIFSQSFKENLLK